MIQKVSFIVNHVFAMFCGLVLLGIAFFTFFDVLLGFLFNVHIRGAIEIIELSMPWVISLGVAFALIKGAHVRVTLFMSRIPLKQRRWINGFDHIMGFLFFTMFGYGAWLHFWSSWVVREEMYAALLTLPAWLGKLALPVGLFLMAIQHLIEFARAIREEKP